MRQQRPRYGDVRAMYKVAVGCQPVHTECTSGSSPDRCWRGLQLLTTSNRNNKRAGQHVHATAAPPVRVLHPVDELELLQRHAAVNLGAGGRSWQVVEYE